MDERIIPLAFGLAKGVFHHETDDRVFLIRRFPLKTVSLHSLWKPAVRLLSQDCHVAIETLLTLFNKDHAHKVASVLDDLVLKGFLERQGTPEPMVFPKVSVIIPVRNRPREIAACLASIEKLDYPQERLETIVVDDASTDDTPEMVSRFPVRRIVLDENRQAPFCRNLGARKAAGDILAFVDSDCLVSPTWLKELLPVFRDLHVAVAGGRVDAWFKRSALDRYEAVNSSLIMGRHAMRSRQKNTSFYVPSCNMLVRRKVFLAVDGFKEELVVGEDVDLCWRIQDAGYQVAFEPMGSVFHKHRNRVWAFCRRRFDYGTSEPLLQKRHKTRRKKMVFPFFASLFLAGVLSTFLTGLAPLLIPCAAALMWDTLGRWKIIKKKGIPLPVFSILKAVLRSYLFFVYHLCAFVSRYYLIWAIVLVFIWPLASAVILLLHLVAAVVDDIIKKPHLNPFSFLFLFTLEQLSYQTGVWYGCVKDRDFGSVNPKIVWSGLSEEVPE